MSSSSNSSLLIKMIGVFLIILITFGSIFILSKQADDNSKNTPEQEAARQTAVENAKKLDPNGEKIVLTEELLFTDYTDYYDRIQNSASVASRYVPYIALGLGVVIGVLSTISSISKRNARGKNVNLLVFVPAILIIVLFAGAGIFISHAVKTAADSYPNPENATYSITTMNIVGKETKVTTDKKNRKKNKNKTITTYYIYYDNEKGLRQSREVTKSTYEKVEKNGIYFMAYAEEGRLEKEFQLYDSDHYMLPVDN